MSSYKKCLWNQIQSELTARYPNWRSEILGFGQVGAGTLRACGKTFSDLEVFYNFTLGLLTNSTTWTKVQNLLGQAGNLTAVSGLFADFDPVRFSNLPPSHIDSIATWFTNKKAGAMVLNKSLHALHNTSKLFEQVITKPDTLQNHFDCIQNARPSMCLACELGSASSQTNFLASVSLLRQNR